MSVKVADKIEQFNNGDYFLMDSSAVEYIDKDGNTKSVKQVLDEGTGGTVDLSEYTKTYTSLADLGLTEPVTVSDIYNAMDDNTTSMIGCEDINANITDVPMSYGILTIKKKNNSRFSIEYQNSLGGSATNVKRWIGTLKGTDGTGLYWKELQTEVGEVITSDTITKYGTEILKYPVGTWRIDSVDICEQFTDLPCTKTAGIIEIDSIQPNKSPYEHVYGYRNYTFRDTLSNVVYTRSLNSGNTAGTINRDSGWCATGSHFYKLSQMYLTVNATIQEVIDAVPIGCTALLRTDEFTNWSTLFNGIQYGYFKVEKTVNGLSNIELQDVINPNLRYFGKQSSGRFDKWQQTSSKVTVAINSKTFKIDITKGSQSWNGNMKFGYVVDNSYGEIIISSLGATDLSWSCSEGVRYVKSVTYTIDPDNNAHVTIGVELYDIVYGTHQIEIVGNFGTINSITGDAFTGTSVARRQGIRGRNSGVGILCEVADLGLTYPCTTVQIAQAMRNLTNGANRIPASGLMGVFDNGGNTITDAPSQYGLLQINVYAYDRVMIRYDGISGSSYAGSWIGRIKGSNGKFSGITWSKIIIEDSSTDPYSCTGYTSLTGTEDLFTLPCGHYVSATANTTYNYPITDSSNVTAHIYILGHLNEPANNKGYRMILYFDNKGRTYNANEWWGGFNPWNRIDNDTRVTTLETGITTLNSKTTELNSKITTLNTKTTELNSKITTIENTKIAAINTKIAAIENTTNTSAIKNITNNTLTATSSTFKVVVNAPVSDGYWFIKFKYYIGGKEYEALIMSEVYDNYWSGNAPKVSSITGSANSQSNGTWNFTVGIKLSSSVTGVKIVECPSVVNLVSFTTASFTGNYTYEKKS